MRRRRERTVQMENIDGHRSGRGEEESEYAPRDFADWREIPSEALERKEVRQAAGGGAGHAGSKNIARSSCCAIWST